MIIESLRAVVEDSFFIRFTEELEYKEVWF